jgi:hypothetical protein
MASMVKDVPLVTAPSDLTLGAGLSNPPLAGGVIRSATRVAAPFIFELNSLKVTGGEKLLRYFNVVQVDVVLILSFGGHLFV